MRSATPSLTNNPRRCSGRDAKMGGRCLEFVKDMSGIRMALYGLDVRSGVALEPLAEAHDRVAAVAERSVKAERSRVARADLQVELGTAERP